MSSFLFVKSGATHHIVLNPETKMGDVVALLTENLGENPAKAALLFAGECIATTGFNDRNEDLFD